MVNVNDENQDWEYCSVNMSVQKPVKKVIETATEKTKLSEQMLVNNLDAEDSNIVQNELSNSETMAIEEVLAEDHDMDLKINVTQTLEQVDNVRPDNLTETKQDDIQEEQEFDIDVFIPSLLLSFESLLKCILDDLVDGLKNHGLYSKGLAQYLKLEDEQVNGNAVKLRYRLPIDNVKLVFEAMN